MKPVCCVMLANGREAMVRRAVHAFQAQTYSAKRLLIWDTGELNRDFDADGEGTGEIVHIPAEAYRERRPSIGALRNEANGFWTEYPIILHWDSDDWSHPNRIAEQVALLESTGIEAVGYRDMLFWDSTKASGEAWLYSCRNPHYCLGTSLCYWREVWARHRFTENNVPGEDDTQWIRGLQTRGQSSLAGSRDSAVMVGQPRMIASIHGGNTCAKIDARAEEWKRVPEWDQHCYQIWKEHTA